MDATTALTCLALGVAASLLAGAASGRRIGAEALGPELAGAMGALFGGMAGAAAVVAGLVVLALA